MAVGRWGPYEIEEVSDRFATRRYPRPRKAFSCSDVVLLSVEREETLRDGLRSDGQRERVSDKIS